MDGIPFHLCPSCDGVLVPHGRMIPLLEKLAAPMESEIDVDAHVESIPPPKAATPCPKCTQQMGVNGYMGTRMAYVAGCSKCGLAWLDANALEAIVILRARTDKRVEDSRAEDKVMRRPKSYYP